MTALFKTWGNRPELIARRIYHCSERGQKTVKYSQQKWSGNLIERILGTDFVIILIIPLGVVCPSNCALPMPGTADGDVVGHCQVLGRAGSVHHGTDQ